MLLIKLYFTYNSVRIYQMSRRMSECQLCPLLNNSRPLYACSGSAALTMPKMATPAPRFTRPFDSDPEVPSLFLQREVAELLGVSQQALIQRRAKRQAPEFI